MVIKQTLLFYFHCPDTYMKLCLPFNVKQCTFFYFRYNNIEIAIILLRDGADPNIQVSIT